MRFLNHWMEIVTTVRLNGHSHEVCASVVAHHDQMSHELVVYRDTFARRADSYGPDEYAYPEWLPDPDVVRVICAAENADALASQYFTDWTKHVVSRIPEQEPEPVPARGSRRDDYWATGSD